MKICNKCKESKDESSFHRSARFGLYPTFKQCVSDRRKESRREYDAMRYHLRRNK